MIKNTTSQLIFETIYIVLAIIGTIASLGYFNKTFVPEFYIYYTNISNYTCLIVMICCLNETIKNANLNKNDYVSFCPRLNFICTIIIIMTFVVFNSSLFMGYSIKEYALSLNSLCFHLILPIMFTLHWLIFFERGNIHLIDPLLAIIFPILYITFVSIRALLIESTASLKYPYFFLNIPQIGLIKFFAWILLLIFIMLCIGFSFYLIDSLSKKSNYKAIKTIN